VLAGWQVRCYGHTHEKTPVTRPDTRAAASSTRALDVFSEHGFEGSSLQQIADRLELTNGSALLLLPPKDELLEALVEPAITGVEEMLESCSGEPDTAGSSESVHGALLDYLARTAAAHRLHHA